jgi:riboflavin synthase
MFTGIVEAKGLISKKIPSTEGQRLQIEVPEGFNKDLKEGASVAVNGVCLTVTEYSNDQISFDVIKETLRVTNLGDLNKNSEVNIERSLKFGDEVGGHLLSGHISCACKASLSNTEDEVEILVDKPENWGQYIYPKGYIALNGVSLTVGKVSDKSFSVYLIPETIRSTNLLTVEDGARLNLEIDQGVMASYENEKKILKNTGEEE